MKRNVKATLDKLILSFFIFLGCISSMKAQDDKKHEMENMHVSIDASSYKTSKFIDVEEIKGKKYITGKSSSYNKDGEANAGILLQPCAEYEIRTKLPGGTYNITVFYQIDKEKAPETPRISIGMNTQKAQDIEIKNKLINSVKTSFKVKFIKGKKHTVKVWLPSAGVKIREVKIHRAILPKKN